MDKMFMKSNERGFTLIEVIVAGAIIAVAMMSIEPLLISAMRTDKQTYYRVRAQQAVTQQLDNLLSQATCSNLAQPGSDYVDAQTGVAYASAPSVPVVITRTWVVSTPSPACNASDPESVCQCPVTVTTSYVDSGGTKTFTLSSLKGN